ncbi:hypothetical protein ALQ54_00286 [Pseudomonas syringae]|uniref:hypothetical protein n=1 Tax=Pseudomonas syringae TaxID=317 RepID=UPI000EFAE758|nr:hypothetical protein [Pseudomonas syringae]RMN70397.1 hypothetical protein ALQ54_00286 [Pseudomonas syringae]
MNDQMIAELFAQIGFKVDLKGIQQAKGALKHLEQQAKATGKAMQQSMKQSAGGGSPKAITAATQAQTKAQFAAQLQGAKLTALNNKSAASGLQTQQQQVKLQIQQQKLAAQTAVSQAQAARAQLQNQAQALRNQVSQLSLVNAAANAQARASQNALRDQLLQHRLARAQAGATPHNNAARSGARMGGGILGFGASSVHRFGGFGSVAGTLAGGGVNGVLGGLAGEAAGASTALGSILGPAALVVAAFAAVTAAAYGFAREAERAANTKNLRLGQFESVGDRTPENAERMNNRFENFAQINGLSTKATGESYAKLTNALSGKVGVDKGADITEAYMRFAVAQHLTNQDMQRSSLGVRQAFGFGQLKAQETNQILEPLGAHGMAYASEAWQRAKGGKLTGDAASKEFLSDRQDRKISGDMLTKWFSNFAEILDSHANDGDLLNKGRQTQQAWDNRVGNQFQANLSSAYEDTGLKKSMSGDDGLYANFVTFLHELNPAFVSLGDVSNTVIIGLTGVIKMMTQAAAWFNNGSSFFNPEFTKGLGESLSKLGDTISILFNSLGDGKSDLAIGVLKTLGEVVIGVITGLVDALTMLVRGAIQISRFLQAAYYSAPVIGDKDKYQALQKQWAYEDKQFNDRMAARSGAQTPTIPDAQQAPQPQSNIPQVDPNAKWRSPDNSDIPVIPQVMAAPPLTSPVQPAINGKAGITNNNTTTVHFTTGPTTITTGVHASELEDKLAKASLDAQAQFNAQFMAMAAPTNISRSRGN